MSASRAGQPAVTGAKPRWGGPDLIGWAAAEAARALADLPDRWRHSQEVAMHAWWAAAGLPVGDRETLVAAAYVHDIGYAADLVETGFHPIDGARYLESCGQETLARLAAHHSGADIEARHRGLLDALAQFPPLPGAVADALTYCDATTGPHGETIDPGTRYEEIIDRHGPDSIVARSRLEARVETFSAVIRTLRLVSRARPSLEPFTVSTVYLGCTTLIRPEGALTAATAPVLYRTARAPRSTGKPTHAVVLDLALVDSLSRPAASELISLSADPTGLTLLEPSRSVIQTLRDVAIDTHSSPKIADSITAALKRPCTCS